MNKLIGITFALIVSLSLPVHSQGLLGESDEWAPCKLKDGSNNKLPMSICQGIQRTEQ
ncbi:hypothetical protein [Motilimonas pumila]|uniref:hypothetical protein n=1 Tax=Motilimonas pumila TaxID=2303987 RepID=UPI001314FB55|nr:hypothetical protein [Motilimonas pumila]